MSTVFEEILRMRVREELERLGLSQAQAARRMGENEYAGLRDVCNGRKRATAEFVYKLNSIGVDVSYIFTGERSGTGIGEFAVHQAVLDAVDLLSLERKIDAQQLAKAVVKLCVRKASIDAPRDGGQEIHAGGTGQQFNAPVHGGNFVMGDVLIGKEDV
jgi:transcriptional regulator with XRE-family HTH domain